MSYGNVYSELALGNKIRLTHDSPESAKSFNQCMRIYHTRHKYELEFLDANLVLSITRVGDKESTVYEYNLIKARTSLMASVVKMEVIANE